ncbi:hypothetical protein F5Y15DRAFT_255311 [Xylariaceae sp. FL0016]|nr:hypothetical protein F5Y15DRAFT_255311 [Xylariaceae sp. FL0016]
MVSFRTIATSALAALPLASAYITGLSTPSTAAAGSTVKATLTTSIYIQNWVDFSIVWGLGPPEWAGEQNGVISVGTQIDYTALYPDNEPTGNSNNFTVDVKIPKSQSAGDYLLVAAIPYLVGASGETQLYAFNSSISITA